jgi:hypothetical protein
MRAAWWNEERTVARIWGYDGEARTVTSDESPTEWAELQEWIKAQTDAGLGDPLLGPVVDYSTILAVRREVQRRLATHVDPLVSNPLRWGALSSEEQGAVAQYRQQLLDLTHTMKDPEEIAWPPSPFG